MMSYYSVSPPPRAGSVPPAAKPKHKPVNVFSNDGSFLERFQQMKKDEEERKKHEEIIARKREFENRYRMRGKRPLPPAENSNDVTENPAKKPRVDEPAAQYQTEANDYAGRSLKDDGTGVRPLVK